MDVISASDRRQLAELKADLLTLEEGRPSVIPELPLRLSTLLGGDAGLAYSLRPADPVDVGFFHAAGFPGDAQRSVARTAVTAGFLYDLLHPERRQRNSVLDLDQLFALTGRRPAGPGVAYLASVVGARFQQLRVLVCDGDELLGWVGAFRGRGRMFGAREQGLLAELTPVMRRRLWLERELGQSEARLAVLESLLEQTPTPALVVAPDGSVRHANTVGRTWLDEDPRGRHALLQAAMRGGAGPFEVSRLTGTGFPPYALLVLRHPAQADPQLTAREREVLALLARGASYEQAGLALGIALNTVRRHVTRIYERLHVSTKAEAVLAAVRLGIVSAD